jgi:hypothetical protein
MSFDLAAEGYSEAVGASISADSVRRVSEGWGRAVAVQRAAEAERANAPAQRGESPMAQRVDLQQPVTGQANVSTDGGMLLVRGEGWKETKLTAISQVTVQQRGADAQAAPRERDSRRAADQLVTLSAHSYQAGLWEADQMARYQYAEGLRRGLEQRPALKLSSANDGALWIERITQTNFPQAIQIVDWSHASGRLWSVAHDVFGEHCPAAGQWAEDQLDLLWTGQVAQVVAHLEALGLAPTRYTDLTRQAPGYFRERQAQMRYDLFRAEGLPIGSGTVESGVNTVVHHRLHRPGRGWEHGNADAMLAALSELHSRRFDHAWRMTRPGAP